MQLCCMPRGFFSSDVSGVVFCNNSLFQPTFGRCRWIMTDVFSLAAFWVSLSSNLLWSKWLPDETMAPVQRHDLPSYHLRTEVVEILRFDDVMAALEKKKIHARKIINSWLQLKNQPLFQTSKLTSFFYLKKMPLQSLQIIPRYQMHRWYDLRLALRLWGSSLATVVRPLGFWTARCFLPRCFSV